MTGRSTHGEIHILEHGRCGRRRHEKVFARLIGKRESAETTHWRKLLIFGDRRRGAVCWGLMSRT